VLLSAPLIKKFNERVVMKVAMGWFILFSIPIYKWAIESSSPLSLFLLQIFIMLGDAPQIAALAIFLPKLFPTNRRYSGLGLSYSLGQALIGGTTPLIAAYFVYTTNQAWAPSYFLCITSLLYLVAIIKTETKILKNI
jgi:MHS family proline/betaine transporter-like MFS transporter